MRSVLLLFTLVISAIAGPWDMAKLSAPPHADWGATDGLTREVWYDGEPFAGKPTRIFAYVGRPEGAGPFPAVVLVHGGGGKAFRAWAMHWARRGYVAIAMDTAGKAPGKAPNPDAGPNQRDKTKFRTDLPPEDMWTYHAVAAAIRGHSLLLSLPEVDPARTALTGISWGGYLTCIIAGVDHRFKAAVPVYGCGFLHENSFWLPTLTGMPPEARAQWVKNWDPSSYLADVQCPILFFNGTNDFAYPLDSYRKCHDLVPPDLRSISLIVELKHGHYWEFPEPDAFIDAAINNGPPVAKLGPIVVKDGSARAGLTATDAPAKAEFHYTPDTGPWQKRKWHTVPAEVKDGTITASLPDPPPLTCYLSITDSRGVRTSTVHEELK